MFKISLQTYKVFHKSDFNVCAKRVTFVVETTKSVLETENWDKNRKYYCVREIFLVQFFLLQELTLPLAGRLREFDVFQEHTANHNRRISLRTCTFQVSYTVRELIAAHECCGSWLFRIMLLFSCFQEQIASSATI